MRETIIYQIRVIPINYPRAGNPPSFPGGAAMREPTPPEPGRRSVIGRRSRAAAGALTALTGRTEAGIVLGKIMEKPEVPQKQPYVLEVEPGTYAWCACGLSTNQPYCDGSHKNTAFRPVVEKITEKKTVAWCGCKNTGSPPFCDGSHSAL